MKNDVQVFQNDVFGSLRTINENGRIMFVASDVAKILGYARPADAVRVHCRYTAKHSIPHPQGKGTLEVNIIPEGDLYRLITHSKLSAAEKFESWVFDEVLPSIRKTGSYKAKPLDESKSKRLAVMERNAKVREAKLWKELAEGATGTYAEVCKTYAVNTLAGKEVLSLPEAGEKTYSATEVGKILGISANMVGKIANKYKLKIDKFGKWFHDKSQHSSKEVETFRYNEDGIAMLRSMAQMKVTENDDEVTYSTTVDLTEKGGKRFCAPLTISLPKKC